MEYRRLGRTDLQVSVMGLGSGGPSQLGQRIGATEAESRQLARRALDLGINLIDTGEGYGESEVILGRALAGVPREDYVLCTKFNPVHLRRDPSLDGDPLHSEADLVESLERSLRRLATDHVDVYQFHNVRPMQYKAICDRFLPVLRRQQEAGKVRFIGVTESFSSDHGHEMLTQALAHNIFDTMMVGYNLLTPLPEEHVLPEAARWDVGILVMCAVRRVIARPERLVALIASLKDAGDLAREALPETDPLNWLLHDGVDSVPAAAY